MKFLFALFLTIFASSAFGQQPDTVLLKTIMSSYPQYFKKILDSPGKNEVQILYTQIDRDEKNIPHFTSYSFNLKPGRYFYPASTVKLPTAIFSLEKLNKLNIHRLNSKTRMETDSDYLKQVKVSSDSTAKDGYPSIENYIKRILLVSDNDAYNRLYEFVDRGQLNAMLKQHGINNTRIVSRLAVGDKNETARHTNPIRFTDNGNLVYLKPSAYDSLSYPMHLDHMFQGIGYMDKGKLINKPFDFSAMNVYPVMDQQLVLRKLLFPEAFSKVERFDLKREDYKLLYTYMSMFPTESKLPTYKSPDYYPAYCKFLFYGGDSSAHINPNIRIFNKVGDSYGYDIDNAYIVDYKHKVEFLLTVVIQSNEDGIYNDDKYEYTTVCLPFMKNIGQVIYNYELSRPKKYLPNLKKFKIKY
jgi:hypothetical protein